MKHVSVVQHTQSEWLGAIEDHLEGRGIRFSYFRPFASGGSLPDVMTLGDGLMLLGGGPWGAATAGHLLPSLEAEVRLARACLMLGKPVVGFGLGSQILSLAADGGVASAPFDLVCEMALRARDRALAGHLPPSLPFIAYGRDRATPPDYAEILAVDESGAPAVFQIGANALGLAANPGIRPAMIEDLVMEFEEAPPDVGARLPAVAAIAAQVEDALVPLMTGIVAMTGWMAS